MSERFPNDDKAMNIAPGDPCEVRVGDDLLITGYVDAWDPEYSARGHEISVSGRSKCQDLIDCSAVLPNMTVSAATLLQLATDLAKPFGIAVTEPDGEGKPLVTIGAGIPQFSITLGQSPWEVLEPIARWLGMLLYDGTDGNLVLAKVGKSKHASGFAQGANALSFRAPLTMDLRYSHYLPAVLSVENIADVAAAIGSTTNTNRYKIVEDKGVPRYRPKFVVSDQIIQTIVLAENAAQWEAARRRGRSQSVVLVADSWRDKSGKLWTPNTLAYVDLPSVRRPKTELLIAEVTFSLSIREGQTARLTLMPPEAFTPQPTFGNIYDPQVAAEIAAGRQAQVDKATEAQRADDRRAARPGEGIQP